MADVGPPQKSIRKVDKAQPEELDVAVLTDDGLREELLKHGVTAGPIVGEFTVLAAVMRSKVSMYAAHTEVQQLHCSLHGVSQKWSGTS